MANATDTITLIEGYEAVRIFLEAVSLRLADEPIGSVAGRLKWVDGAPVDPTMWQDWLAAVQIVRDGR